MLLLKINICLVLCLFFSCVSTKNSFQGRKQSNLEKKAPGWIDGSSVEFPSTDYFVGVGVSSTGTTMNEKLNASKDVARAEIAKIFKVKIESISEETIRSTLRGTGKYSTRENQENYSTFVRSSTDLLLEGVEIRDSYKNNRGEVYTLAVLNKQKALNLFQKKITNTLKSIEEEAQQAARALSEKKPLLAIKFNRAALLSAYKIDLLNAQIMISGGKAVNVRQEYVPNFIKIRIDRLFSSISISIKGENDVIAKYILEVLTGLGFRIMTNTSNSDYLIKYSYSFVDDGTVKLADDYISYKARSNLSLEFFKRNNSKVVGEVNLVGRGVGKNAELAGKHSIQRLSQVIQDELAEAIFKFL